MADAVPIFSPGFRVTDSGGFSSGAVIEVYDFNTTDPKIVYADSSLSTELGTSVTCDSLGYPTSNGTTKTLIYVGPGLYKIVIKTSTGVVIADHDYVPGAVIASSGSSGSTAITTTRPVVTKSLDYTIEIADEGKIFVTNCSSGDVIYTMPSAVTLGAGKFFTIQHAGSANQAVISTVSSQTISEGSKSFGTSFTLSGNGECATFVSDGGNWRVVEHTVPFFKPGQGIITIIDRLNTPPGSPGQGAAYIVTASPTGAWSGFALHDIAYYTGASWINFAPSTDCGWIAFVQDENINYQFKDSAWVADSATTALAGTVQLADQAAVEAETAGRAVTAEMLKFGLGVAKAAITFNGTGTPSNLASFNVSSITDNGTGDYTINFTTAFSSVNYFWTGGANFGANGTNGTFITETARTTSSIRISVINAGGLVDLSRISLLIFGDFA